MKTIIPGRPMKIVMPDNPLQVFREEMAHFRKLMKDYRFVNHLSFDILSIVGIWLVTVFLCIVFILPVITSVSVISIGIIPVWELLMSLILYMLMEYLSFYEIKREDMDDYRACTELNDEDFERYISEKMPNNYMIMKNLQYIKEHPHSLLSVRKRKIEESKLSSCKITYEIDGKVEEFVINAIHKLEERTDIEESCLIWEPFKYELLLRVEE